jgi:large subunit ribosomal protein L29
MKNSEIKELSTKDILERIEDQKMVLYKAKLNHAVSPLENPNILKDYRITIARLKTELNKRKLTEKNIENGA